MSAPINIRLERCRPCPCGCGTMLYPYNDGMPLVCFSTWRQAADEDKRVIMLPGSTVLEKSTAEKAVLDLALAIKRGREA